MRDAQRGIALLLVLAMTLAVATIVAIAQHRAALELRRTRNLLFADQELAYQLGAEDWAGALLVREGRDDDTDDLTEPWNQQGLVLPIEGGRIVGSLRDLQGRFNVNNLLAADGAIDEVALAQLRRLVAALGVEDGERVALEVADWLDADQDPRFPYGAEDGVYLRLVPAYRSADRRLLWVGELRAVAGIDAAAFDALAPHLAALPGRTALNVNTASREVLRSLSDAADGADLDGIAARQLGAPFGTVGEFAAEFPFPVPEAIVLGVRSEHFALTTTVAIEGLTTTMYSQLARVPGGAVRTLRRSVEPEP